MLLGGDEEKLDVAVLITSSSNCFENEIVSAITNIDYAKLIIFFP